MTEMPSKRRCYPVEYCAECQGRLPMRHLYKPYGMMSHHNIVDVDSEFANRWVCTETEDNREIKLHPSLDFPDWCPLKVIPDGLDITARQEQQMGLPYDYCREICDQYNHCSHRNAETCQSHKDKILLLKEHDAAIRNAVLDELGILHGEDAKRFTEQLDHPEPLTPEARDLVMQAKKIAQKERTALDDRDRLVREDERRIILDKADKAIERQKKSHIGASMAWFKGMSLAQDILASLYSQEGERE